MSLTMKKSNAKRTVKQSAAERRDRDAKPDITAATNRIGEFLAKRRGRVGVGAGVGVSQADTTAASGNDGTAGNVGAAKSGIARPDGDTVGETLGNGRSSGATGSSGSSRADRRRRVDPAGTGAGTGDSTGAGTGAEERASEVGEIPVRVVIDGKGKKKKTQAETKAEQKFQAAIMVGLLQTFISGGFQSIALFVREPHWQLQAKEAEAVAIQLNACLETLPKGTYEQFEKLVSKYVPWLGLALTVGAVTGPRIEQSRANRATKETRRRSPERAEQAEPDWSTANPWQYGSGGVEWGNPRTV